jgi:hypothetical protein
MNSKVEGSGDGVMQIQYFAIFGKDVLAYATDHDRHHKFHAYRDQIFLGGPHQAGFRLSPVGEIDLQTLKLSTQSKG